MMPLRVCFETNSFQCQRIRLQVREWQSNVGKALPKTKPKHFFFFFNSCPCDFLRDATKTLVCASVLAIIDYCNSLLVGFPHPAAPANGITFCHFAISSTVCPRKSDVDQDSSDHDDRVKMKEQTNRESNSHNHVSKLNTVD